MSASGPTVALAAEHAAFGGSLARACGRRATESSGCRGVAYDSMMPYARDAARGVSSATIPTANAVGEGEITAETILASVLLMASLIGSAKNPYTIRINCSFVTLLFTKLTEGK
jgi:hypothetical protein